MEHVTKSANAQIAQMSTLAVKGALEVRIIPAFTDATGIHVDTVFDPTAVLKQRISEGQSADLVIEVSADVEELAVRGTVSSFACVPLARTGVGIAVKRGAVKPAIDTIDNLKRTLTSARSVAYSRTGASGIYFAKLIEHLGIAEPVNARAPIVPKGFAGEVAASGEADLAVQQLSELAIVPGVDIIGPLLEEVQVYTEFSSGAFTNSEQKSSALAFLAFLSSKLARAAYRKFDLESLG
jgi:molybdate transport system substrate-binding protein